MDDRRPPVPPPVTVGFAGDDEPPLRLDVATPEELRSLAGDRRAGVRRQVASHPATPPEVLAQLAEDGNLWVRRDAAANPATPRPALERLRRAGSAPGLAGPAPPDPSLEPCELAMLAAGGEWARRLAAGHPATPPEALERLAEDPIPAVRAAVADHPSTPAAVRERLLAGGDEAARREARDPVTPPERLTELATAADRETLLAVAENPRCPADTLAALAARPDPYLRVAVARHTGTSPATLERLAEEVGAIAAASLEPQPGRSPALLEPQPGRGLGLPLALALASNPSCPPPALARLAEHGAVVVREQVAAHPGYAGAHRDLLRRAGSGDDLASFSAPDPDLPAPDLARLARGGGWARLLAARHPATEPELLAPLGADPDPLVRREALANPACPEKGAQKAHLQTWTCTCMSGNLLS